MKRILLICIATITLLLVSVWTSAHAYNYDPKMHKNQRTHSYKQTRRFLFGNIHLERDKMGRYQIYDVYCDRYVKLSSIGPGKIPTSHKMNTEHTWPQSRFSRRFPKHVQKNDLHALFPTSTRSNSMRSNIILDDVKVIKDQPCKASALGRNGSGKMAFEPPDSHKGNAARALFYFSVRYNMRISSQVEKTLRTWNKQDPVDSQERLRHERIAKFQRNRNPFVDDPDLIDQVSDF